MVHLNVEMHNTRNSEDIVLSLLKYKVITDKVFLFLPEFKWNTKYNLKEAWNDFYADSNNKDIVEEIEKNIDIAMEDFIARNPDEDDITFEEYLEFLKINGVKHYKLTKIVDKKKNITKAQKRFKEWFKERKNNYFISRNLKRIKYDTNKEPKDNNRQQRNNAIIQISLSILRNKEVSLAAQIPGNFDTIKTTSRVSDIYTNPKYFDDYKKKYNLKNNKDAVKHLLNNNLEELEDFLKEVKVEDNPLSIDTFIKHHNQNMTGGALIGIYANNTTMQAKFQEKNLKLKDNFTFKVDGKLIKNLTDVYTEEVVNGKTIKKKISQNCAEFSAASVDNGKDPVLASLLQNKKTAKIACFMLRAGMSIPQIGIMFNTPLIRESIQSTGDIENIDIKELEEKIKELKGISKETEYKVSPILDFNTLDMVEATVAYNDSILRINQSKEDEAKLLESIVGYTKGFLYISSLAETLGETVKSYRADSPNGAIEISLSKAKVQVLRVNKILVDSSKADYPFEGVENILVNDLLSLNDTKDEMRDKLLNSEVPLLQSFYSLGIDLGLKTVSNYFASTSESANKIIDFIQSNRYNLLTSVSIDSIYEAINLFGLSSTTLFGNDDNMSMEEKYAYYVNQFPRDFAEIVSNNPDIKALPFIQKLVASNRQGLVMRDSARNTSYLREVLTNSADSLLYLDNPEAHKLAVGLLRYAYYKERLKYGPHTFNQFFSTIFKNAFPEYIETLRELENSMNSDKRWGRLIDQIYANNPTLAEEADFNMEDLIDLGNNSIKVKALKVKNHNYMEYIPLEYILYKGELFKLNKEASDDSNKVYDKLTYTSSLIYNINSDSNDMFKNLELYDKAYYNKIVEDNKKAIKVLQPSETTTQNNTESDTVLDKNKREEFFSGKETSWNLDRLDQLLAEKEEAAMLKLEELKYSPEEGLKEADEKPCKSFNKEAITKDAFMFKSM